MLRWSLPLLALLAGCAATPREVAQNEAMLAREEAELQKALAGRVAGTPQSCLNTRNMNAVPFGDRILYRMSPSGRGPVYVNNTNGGCFGLRRNDIIVGQTPMAQFCRGDILQTVDPVSRFPSGSCAYGDFIPYVRPPN